VPERVIEIADEIDIGRARRAAMAVCLDLKFGKIETACVATSVAELARNLWQHAQQGRVTLRWEAGDAAWLEVQTDDLGPGIIDIELAMQDGYSTAGGLGSGLPGVKRLMDTFEITSTLSGATRIIARKWAKATVRH